jgi:uncharacterized membrane protein YgdD (TMEM256/DUF423 family)
MTLNTNYPGAVRMAGRPRLEGPERGLDALVGLVILTAELFIGLTVILGLFDLGTAASATNPSASETISAGFAIALFGAAVLVIITTVIYLARVIIGRRSWPAPLWGTILMSVALIIGYAVMAGGL